MLQGRSRSPGPRVAVRCGFPAWGVFAFNVRAIAVDGGPGGRLCKAHASPCVCVKAVVSSVSRPADGQTQHRSGLPKCMLRRTQAPLGGGREGLRRRRTWTVCIRAQRLSSSCVLSAANPNSHDGCIQVVKAAFFLQTCGRPATSEFCLFVTGH